MTRVKICGLTNLADAQCAAEAGADMLGFILYPPSPRAIEVTRAARVVGEIRAAYGVRSPLCVGVFVNEPPGRVRAVIKEVGLDLARSDGQWYVLEANMKYGTVGLREAGVDPARVVGDMIAAGEI